MVVLLSLKELPAQQLDGGDVILAKLIGQHIERRRTLQVPSQERSSFIAPSKAGASCHCHEVIDVPPPPT
jgi:hypothetical protein